MGRVSNWFIQTLKGAGWAPLAVFALHVVLSKGFGAYLLCPSLDIPVHFAGGAAIAFFLLWACRTATRAGFLGQPNEVALFLLAFALTCMAAVTWEFTEFVSDRFFGTHAQLGLEDTLSDILYGIIGGVALLIIAGARQIRRGPKNRTVSY